MLLMLCTFSFFLFLHIFFPFFSPEHYFEVFSGHWNKWSINILLFIFVFFFRKMSKSPVGCLIIEITGARFTLTFEIDEFCICFLKLLCFILCDCWNCLGEEMVRMKWMGVESAWRLIIEIRTVGHQTTSVWFSSVRLLN